MCKFRDLFAILLLSSEFLFTQAALQLSTLEQYEGVKYLTYTKTNKDKSVDIRRTEFADTTIVVVIHDFGAKDLSQPLQVKDDLFNTDPNIDRVIVVDWRDYAASDYLKVAEQHVPLLATDLYEKIGHIRKSGNHGTIQIVGHGIGAHVAGKAGRLLKKKNNYELDEIFGLDPSGGYFVERWDFALRNDDAKKVVRFNTNMKKNDKSDSSIVGLDDINVNGGQKQPNCKINVDKCSHNEAWHAFSDYLNNKSGGKNASTDQDINDVSNRIHPYVICLDVSMSMGEENRLERAVQSAKKTISKLKTGSFLGFVKFSRIATIVHDITQLKGSEDRKSLMTSMPTTLEYYTSIGSGLRKSLNMLQAMPSSAPFCSTIVLISDGEENTPEYAKDVLPDLKKHCVKVSTIALGKDASKELEDLSAGTGGVVAYSPETKTNSDIVGTIKAFSYVFEGQTDEPIRLHSKDVTLSSSEEKTIQFTIDDTVGNETEFVVISHGIDKVDVKLKSPDGELFFSNSPYYFSDDLAEKRFTIPFADPGEWSLIVSRNSKTRRSTRSTVDATVTATSHERANKPTIQLKAELSHQTLEYPKPITVSAELKMGELPIIYANVFASISAPDQATIRLPLNDDGVFPDELANDGIYTNDIVKLQNIERYTVSIAAQSDEAMTPPKQVNYLLRDTIDCKTEAQKCTKLSRFQREAEAGSVKLASQQGLDRIPPHKVSDLRGAIKNAENKTVSLEWTSPRNELFSIQIKRYDIRILVNGTDFEEGFELQDLHVVEGSLNALSNSINKTETISFEIPTKAWNSVVMKFALKSIGDNGEPSEISNLALVETLVAVSGGSNVFIWQFASHCRSLSQIVVVVLILLNLK